MPNFYSGVSLQFSSVSQSCLTLCKPVDCNMLGFPATHHPAVPSSSAPFFSRLQSLPASGAFTPNVDPAEGTHSLQSPGTHANAVKQTAGRGAGEYKASDSPSYPG